MATIDEVREQVRSRYAAAAVALPHRQGIDITAERPKILTTDAVRASDVVVTRGCGDTCPYYPGKRYEDWVLDDPAGQDLATARRVRDQIRGRVDRLLSELDEGAGHFDERDIERAEE